jgi:aminopeptidase N
MGHSRYFLAILILIAAHLAACQGMQGPIRNLDRSLLEAGISKPLAEARADLLDEVEYDLSMKLDEGAVRAEGEVRIRFRLAQAVDRFILDFAGQEILHFSVNGTTIEEPARIANHISIDGNRLSRGRNTIHALFVTPVGEGGTALTRYRDRSDGNDYYYTLLVPGDAHQLFPCFDQPDVKARVRITLELPDRWIAVANSPVALKEVLEDRPGFQRISFMETAPISTYLVAFTAGPFVRVADERPGEPMAFFVRPSRRDDVDAKVLFDLHRAALDWLEEYFSLPYPFKKFEFVLLPGFPYGGMEHVGNLYYRETMLAFESTPTAAQLLRRSILIYHEVSHQWFGDLVTMEWFDDVWLKEGFATFLSYKMLESLEPEKQAWKRFSQRVEPRAYQVEATRGTTPVWQELDNLAEAKSTYGAIVYNKAPALLRQLEFLLGERKFQDASTLFVLRHAFGCATWRDLIQCCEEASGRELAAWSEAWILRKGMPRVTLEFVRSSHGFLEGLLLLQEGVHDPEACWPFRTRLALVYDGGGTEIFDVFVRGKRTEVDLPMSGESPRILFANAGDFAYGRFPFDPSSLDAVLSQVHLMEDPFLQSLFYDTLWDMVRAAELSPISYIEAVLRIVDGGADPLDLNILLGRVAYAFDHYLSEEQVNGRAPEVEASLRRIFADEALDPMLRHTAYRAFLILASTGEGLDLLAGVLAQDRLPSDMPQSPRDRWDIIKQLIVQGYDQAGSLFEAEVEADESVDAEKYRFEVRAAFPDAQIKEEYFAYYQEETAYPEAWLEASLSGFNAAGQSDLTLPFLKQALDRAEWTKEHRKIFFLPRWLDAFIQPHKSRSALEVVENFLEERKDLSYDIVLKILQSMDPLEKKLLIRTRFANEG